MHMSITAQLDEIRLLLTSCHNSVAPLHIQVETSQHELKCYDEVFVSAKMKQNLVTGVITD